MNQYAPQPFIAVATGSADESPATAKPIALYGVGSGGGGTVHTDDVVNEDLYGSENLTVGLTNISYAIQSIMMLTEEISETRLVTTITDLTARIEALEAAAE